MIEKECDKCIVLFLVKLTLGQEITCSQYGKGQYETDYKRPIYVKGNKTYARDSSFRLLYLLLRTKLEDEISLCQEMYQAILCLVTHRAIFK